MPGVFATPLATRRIRPTAWTVPSARQKRKRSETHDQHDSGADEHDGLATHESSPGKGNPEYSAVLTPDERFQKQRAGHPLDEDFPPRPFPHAGILSTQAKELRATLSELGPFRIAQYKDAPPSLHLQHLSALTAILHRSILKEDWPRASRAIGLLFREDLISRDAALRNMGYMGIAAETLLRRNDHRPTSGSSEHIVPLIEGGFENAKRFYELLIVRHPYQKSWPDAVNAVDFHLAMFNIWVYALSQQSRRLDHEDEGDDNGANSELKVRILQQASEITSKIDTLMATVPYMDEPEFIRLRAMVGLWLADLYEDQAFAETPVDALMDIDAGPEPTDLELTSPVGNDLQLPVNPFMEKAARARKKARDLLSRLAERVPVDDNNE